MMYKEKASGPAGQRARRIISRLIGMVVCALPMVVLAQDAASTPAGTGFMDRIKQGAAGAAGPAGLTDTPPLETLIGNVIGTILGFLGVLLLGYIIYAGFLWMTSGGNDTKAKESMTMIKNAVIGLIIIVSAYAITAFVLSRLAATQTNVTVVG